MPGWKRGAGRRLDALVERTVSGVVKAVKWNTPLYGVEGQGFFLGVHCFASFIKLGFFAGAHLDPMPPVASKSGDMRYCHVRETEPLDEGQLGDWIRQASLLPGKRL